jgi:predicted nucleic acid-binding protein
MCLIVDANAAASFLGQPSAIRKWLLGERGEPRLVAAGLLLRELVKLTEVRRVLLELNRTGRLRSVSPERLQQEEARLRTAGQCRSNDVHVLALGIASGARTLATFDRALTLDFGNAKIINKPRGSVYSKPKVHAHLLRHTPKSCGLRG